MHRASRAFHVLASFCATCVLAPLAVAQTPPVQAAPAALVYTPTSLSAEPGLPRTSDGHPDFQGIVWTGTSDFFATLEASPITPPQLVLPEGEAKDSFGKLVAMFTGPAAMKALIESDPEVAAALQKIKGFPLVRGTRRTRLLVQPADGKLPLTPEARKEPLSMFAIPVLKTDNPEDRSSSERCLSGYPPMAVVVDMPVEFIQTPDHVVIHTEAYDDEVRIVPFASARGPANGNSLARWDGDTLVIETTGFPAKDRLRPVFGGALLVNADAKVIERFTRVSKDELLYQFTVEDPKAYAAPWLAEYSLYRAPYRMYPATCHAGNYSMTNILAGGREQERTVERTTLAWMKNEGVTGTTANPDRRWTVFLGGPSVNMRAWAVLAPKDASGEARVALRVEYAKPTSVDSAQALSEIYVYAIDCGGQKLRRLSRAIFAAHNLAGDKYEQPTNAGWQAATVLPAIADGIVLACAGS